MRWTTRQSGVDIDAGNEVVRRIRALARGTFTPGVLSEIGSFGGLFQLGARGVADPVLVASADGVGTKLRVAFMTGVHDTIGVDLVNHCVNDILVQGAEPLFFLDYLATGRLDPGRRRADRRGARRARAARTAARCSAARPRRCPASTPTASTTSPASSSASSTRDAADRRPAHRAGRRADRPAVVRPAHQRLLAGAADRVRHRWAVASTPRSPELGALDRRGAARAAPLVPAGRPAAARRRALIKGMAHITGGGITDNLPRILPDGHAARRSIARAWEVPPIFQWLQQAGGVPRRRHAADVQHGHRPDPRVRAATRAPSVDRRAGRRPASPRRVRIGAIVAGATGVVY